MNPTQLKYTILQLLVFITHCLLTACSTQSVNADLKIKNHHAKRVINGKPITDEINFILEHKPVYASATLDLRQTQKRNANQLDRLSYLQKQLQQYALTNTPFNRNQQKQLAEEINHLLKIKT